MATQAPGFEALLESHELAWHQLWRRFRIVLTGDSGPATAQMWRMVRLSMFHVLQAVSRHNVDLDAGIPARGLHGEAYRGHVFQVAQVQCAELHDLQPVFRVMSG
jgi:trehalose/maltose hydrolase-like predicted phosphorylase